MLKLCGKNEQGETVADETRDHEFWKTQPVPALNANIPKNVNYPIEPDKKKEEISKEPLPLPEGLKFVTVNLHKEEEIKEMYNLLCENYVEDASSSFRFKYSPDFLRWALTPPGYKPDWIVGIRKVDNNELICLITAIPVTIRLQDRAIKMAEVNFLCVNKNLRDKRIAPLLIQEITRRIHLTGFLF